jgi:rhamnosyltransferase
VISILIPTYNAENFIRELLDSLYAQKLNEMVLEIIVVDSDSKDRTVEIIRDEYPNVHVKLIDNFSFNHGGTRNILASLASGDYLLYMTQDAIPCNDSVLLELLKPFHDDPRMAISYARQIPRSDAKLLEVFARGFNYPETPIIKDRSNLEEMGIKTFFNSNVCSMYKRDLFEKFGQFPEQIILNEDLIFASKVILSGYKVSYSAKATVHHSHNYSLKQQFKRYFDIGMAFEEMNYLLEHASNEKEGLRMLKKQYKFLFSKGAYHLIPLAIAETAAKFIGYKIGKKHRILPKKMIRKSSAYLKV